MPTELRSEAKVTPGAQEEEASGARGPCARAAAGARQRRSAVAAVRVKCRKCRLRDIVRPPSAPPPRPGVPFRAFESARAQFSTVRVADGFDDARRTLPPRDDGHELRVGPGVVLGRD